MCKFPAQVDVPYQYLTFFMEDDDELKRIGEALGWSRTQGIFSIPWVGCIIIEQRVMYLLAEYGA